GGIFGAQGDGIDVKGGLKQLTVSGNNIHDINTVNGCRGIVMQGQIVPTSDSVLQVYERNYIHDCTGASEGIAMSGTWGVPSGVVIRNNIISNISDPSESRGYGLFFYSSQHQILAQNNTIYNCLKNGLVTSTGGSYLLRNNLLIANNASGNQVDLSHGTIDSDYNAYSNTWGY